MMTFHILSLLQHDTSQSKHCLNRQPGGKLPTGLRPLFFNLQI